MSEAAICGISERNALHKLGGANAFVCRDAEQWRLAHGRKSNLAVPSRSFSESYGKKPYMVLLSLSDLVLLLSTRRKRVLSGFGFPEPCVLQALRAVQHKEHRMFGAPRTQLLQGISGTSFRRCHTPFAGRI